MPHLSLMSVSIVSHGLLSYYPASLSHVLALSFCLLLLSFSIVSRGLLSYHPVSVYHVPALSFCLLLLSVSIVSHGLLLYYPVSVNPVLALSFCLLFFIRVYQCNHFVNCRIQVTFSFFSLNLSSLPPPLLKKYWWNLFSFFS